MSWNIFEFNKSKRFYHLNHELNRKNWKDCVLKMFHIQPYELNQVCLNSWNVEIVKITSFTYIYFVYDVELFYCLTCVLYIFIIVNVERKPYLNVHAERINVLRHDTHCIELFSVLFMNIFKDHCSSNC